MFKQHQRYDYFHCNSCALDFIHPMPNNKTISEFYPSAYMVYQPETRLKKFSALSLSVFKMKHGYRHLKTVILMDIVAHLISPFLRHPLTIPYVNGGKLLDVGCGNGRFLYGMQTLGWDVEGVEFNDGAVEVCRSSGLKVHHGDLLSANLPRGYYDVINMSHVIEHVPNPKEVLDELSRLLKPNGFLYLKTPNSQSLGRKYLTLNWYANDIPRHLYMFSQASLKSLSASAGLSMVRCRYYSSPKIILNSFDYINNQQGIASRKQFWKRSLSKIYVYLSELKNQGDELQMVFQKK